MRGRWCNIIVLNVHAPSEEKSDDSKDSSYEKLEQVFDHFPKYHMKIVSVDFNANVWRENIFKPTIGNESLHQESNDIGARIKNFATSTNLVVESTMFPHRSIHKYIRTFPFGKTHNQVDRILIGRRWHSSMLDVRSISAADYDTDHYQVVAKVKEKLAVSKKATHIKIESQEPKWAGG